MSEPSITVRVGDSRANLAMRRARPDSGPERRAMVQRLRSRGFPAQMAAGEYNGHDVFRVRVGAYSDKASAQKVADAIQSREGLQTWVRQ